MIKAGPSTQKLSEPKRRHKKRKRVASEAATSVAGDPPAAGAAKAVVGAHAAAHGAGEGDGGVVEGEVQIEEVLSTPWIDGMGTTSYESKEQRCVVVLSLL